MEMVEGTWMKQLETRLDTMEFGLCQTQEVSRGRAENAATREIVQKLEKGVKEEFSSFG